MKLKNKIKLILCIFTFLLIVFNLKVSAVSISVSTSKSSVSAGESFTATITGTDATGKVSISVSNGTASQSSVWVENDSQSVTITAGSSGTVKVSASGELSSSSGVDQNVSDSASVSIIAQTSDNNSGSTDNSGSSDSGSSNSGDSGNSGGTTETAPILSNLGITPNDFSGFKSSKTSYSVTVPNDCTSVTIYANSNNGTVSGTGKVTLKEGTNKYTITVSNSSGSKDYTLSIIRKTEETEVIPNSTDDTSNDTSTGNSSGIGLTGLRVTGYTFDKEFDAGTYEYTVKVQNKLTEADLEKLKNSITAITESDDMYVETVTKLNDDGSAVIKLIVKDDKKEYSTYTINFVVEEAEEKTETAAIAGTTKNNNSSSGDSSIETITKKMLILLGCLILNSLIAIYYAISSYVKSKRLAKYEPDDFEEEKNENDLVSSIYAETAGKPLNYKELTNEPEAEEKSKALNDRISKMLKDDNKIPDYSKIEEEEVKIPELEEKTNPLKLAKEAEEKAQDLGGYRKYRKSFSGGKH